MFLQLPKNGQRQGVLTLVKGGLDFDVPETAHLPEMLICCCDVCGQMVEVPAESWLSGDLTDSSCEHFEHQGAYTYVGNCDESTVIARCVCGVEDAFDLEREWKSGKVKAITECIHGHIGEEKGVLKIVGLSDADNWLCCCTRCGGNLKISRLAWSLGSYDGSHDCQYWSDRRGCYTDTGRSFHEDQIEARCTCGTVDYFTEYEWNAKVAHVYASCPHSVIGERQGVYRITDIQGAGQYRAMCSQCGYTIYPTHEQWEQRVYENARCEH